MAGPVSAGLFRRAVESIAGGVNSPVRSFRAVGGEPLFIARAKGPYVYDADGRRRLDFLMSWGAIILGHAHADVRRAVAQAARRGNGYGLSTELECRLAEEIKGAFPSVELLRLVNSGTEAVMSALRLARGCTGRDLVLAFEGGYHGHSDGLLARAGSGLTTFGLPASRGVPAAFAATTLLARYNDLDSVEALAQTHGERIAAVLVEPVAGNMGVVPPRAGFLPGLRRLCDRIGALLILDEVITGFRIAWGGAQEKYGVRADLTTLGKIIGGGLPVGAFGGRRELMEQLAPQGEVYQAGTLAGNPVVAAAAIATLTALRRLDPYRELERKGDLIERGLNDIAARSGASLWIGRVGGMFTPFFAAGPVRDYASARKADARRYGEFFRRMLELGILLPPSQWESCFISPADTEQHLERFLACAAKAFGLTRRGRRLSPQARGGASAVARGPREGVAR